MPQRARRDFIRHSVLGAAAVGVVAAAPRALSRPPAVTAATPAASGLPAGQHVVAYVRDVTAGEITVLVGEHEIAFRDRDLASRIARAARHGGPQLPGSRSLPAQER